MNPFMRGLAILTLAGAFVSAANIVLAQSSATSPQKDDFLNAKVADFELHNESLIEGLWKLVMTPAPFGFGFEDVLTKGTRDAGLKIRNSIWR